MNLQYLNLGRNKSTRPTSISPEEKRDVSGRYGWAKSYSYIMETEKTVAEILEDVDYPVIVEGESDRTALESFGVKDIVPLKGRPLFKVVDGVSDRSDKAIVLTDFDSEGRKLAGKLNSLLSSRGVTPVSRIRSEIEKRITKFGISAIENISPDKV